MKRTVFVVGAGASLEFDNSNSMPIGSQLAVQIETLLEKEVAGRRGDGPIASALARSGGLTDAHFFAMSRIVRGIQSRDSIDQFVEDCKDVPELPRIAKLCMAHLLLIAERQSVLGKLQDGGSATLFRLLRDSWLGRICRRANPNVSRQRFLESLDGISFVTFNYDRCIEQFLRQWISSTLAVSVEDAHELAVQVPVLHVFGSLGVLPGQQPGRAGAMVRFGEEDDRYLVKSANEIRTFTEEVESHHSQLIRFEILRAERLIFLGTAFHDQNLQILFDGTPPDDIDYYGTTYEVRPPEYNAICDYFKAGTGVREFEAFKCGAFIDRHDERIFS